jgi:hypothetical protein
MALKEKLFRLGEMDFAELRFRAAQELRVSRERWGVAGNDHTPSAQQALWWQAWDPARTANAALRQALASGRADQAAALLPGYFAQDRAARFFARFFFPDHEAWREIAALYPRLFPGRLEQLRAEADVLCAHRFRVFGYPEVTAGTEIPWRQDLVHGTESGDEHYSRIPYLDFASAGDSKIVWEPNRHQHFFTLGQAWALTGDSRFAEECCAQWEHWLRANPYPRGINWASSLEAAFRAWSWLWAMHLLAGSAALTGTRLGVITQALAQHADYIAANLSTYFSPNTHLLGEGFALYCIGLLLPELRGAAAWRRQGRAILIEQMERQVHPDGAHREQTGCYHRYAAEFFLCAALLGERNADAFPTEYLQRLDRMFEFSLHSSWPAGDQPDTGDDDGGQLLLLGPRSPRDHRALLSTAAVWRARRDFRHAAGGLHEETLWLLGTDCVPAFQSLAPEPPRETSRLFADAGAVIQRSGWDSSAGFLRLDAGPQGMGSCAHGHADALSVLCAADGVEWLVDPGTFVYTSSRPWRDFFRSTRAHNCVTLDHCNQAEPLDPFNWRAIPRVRLERNWMLGHLDCAVASHDGFLRLPGGGVHRRTVVFVKPDYWLIADALEGSGAHTAEFFFHFAADVSVALEGATALARKEGQTFRVAGAAPGAEFRVVRGAAPPQQPDIQGWVAEDYGRRAPALVLEATMRATLPATALWLLSPEASPAPVLQALSPAGAAGLRALVETRHGKDFFSVCSAAEWGNTPGLSTDAELAFLRQAPSGNFTRISLANGCCLDLDGRPLLRAGNWLDKLEIECAGDRLDIRMEPARPLRLREPSAARILVNDRETPFLRRGEWIEIAGVS